MTNPTFRVLTTNANSGLLANGTNVADIALGQIGVVNADTNVGMNIAAADDADAFYIAIGIDSDGDGVVDDIYRTPNIRKDEITNYDVQCYAYPAPARQVITGIEPECGKEYMVKVQAFNGSTMITHGFNDVVKTFSLTVECCDTPLTANQFAVKLVDLINADDEGLFVAKLVDPADNSTVVTNVAAFEAANPGVDLNILIESVPAKMHDWCKVNLLYFSPRTTALRVSTLDGFECNGNVINLSYGALEQGSGYDIRQLERNAGGWIGQPGPYRQSALVGESIGSFNYLAQVNGKYTVFNLSAVIRRVRGWVGQYHDPVDTIIAVPCASTTTRDALVALLDVLAGKTLAGAVGDCINCS